MSQIGMNLRVTESCDQGGRKYMEDRYAVHFERNDKGVVEFGYFGVFDGHGGAEAAKFARDHLLEEITKYNEFWTDDDDDVCQAIKAGFLDTHKAMWKEHDKWPRTSSGFASTSGTTSSICFIKNCKLYIGHVGDSAIVLGRQNSPDSTIEAVRLTKDHKPESPEERRRIENSGGSVMTKSGVNRVVWNRPKQAHQGPVRRSTHIDKIPFLAVARSLGDLWSYDFRTEEFVVSPEPDVSVRHLFPKKDRCLVLGSDGLWNMLSAEEACLTVQCIEKEIEKKIVTDPSVPLNHWVNVSERLVNRALNKWRMRLMRADNTSALVVMIDPLGPSRWLHLRKKREELQKLNNSRNSLNTLDVQLVSSSLDLDPQESFCSRLDNITGCRKFSTSSLCLDHSLPPTPKSAINRQEIKVNGADPMDDFDEVDGDMSIVSNSSLPVIGSEIVIDSSKLITVSDDIRIGNGDLDDIEAAVMEENLRKNIKPPLNSKPTIPLLRTQHSFITFSGSVPASLKTDDSACSNPKPHNNHGIGTPGKLQKLKVKKLGGTPWKTYVHVPPDSPLKIDPNTGRPRVKIIREYLTNPPTPPYKQRPSLGPSPLLPGKPGDKVEIVREYLMKKDPEDVIKVKLPSKPSNKGSPVVPIVSKTKKFNVTIIREYLLKKKKEQHKKKKKQSTFHNGHSQLLSEVSFPSSSTGRHSWTKWLKGRRNIKKSLGNKDSNKQEKPSVPCSSINGLPDDRNKTSSLPSAVLTEELLNKSDNSDKFSSKPHNSCDHKRSASLGNVSLGQVLKIKNCDQNELSTMKTRNSPKGFTAVNCVDAAFEIKTRRMCPAAGNHSPQLTGKEQIERKLNRKKSTAPTNQNSKPMMNGSKDRNTPCEARKSLTRSRFNNQKSSVRTRSHSDSTPVRVLRSLIGMKRKATDLPADRLNVKRLRHSGRGRTS